MLVAITGTPGVGKSTVSKLLAEKYTVIDIHRFAEEHGLFEEYDADAGSFDVDVDRLSDALQCEREKDGYVFMDGHLSHFVDCDAIVVMRCAPKRIYERLKARGYDEKKILENVQAEVLDVILSESVESGIANVHEIDCTDLSPEQVMESVVRIVITKECDKGTPGSVDWSAEMEEWF